MLHNLRVSASCSHTKETKAINLTKLRTQKCKHTLSNESGTYTRNKLTLVEFDVLDRYLIIIL